MLWSLAECTQEGEWIVDNIWQKKAKPPKTQSPETDPSVHSDSDSCMESWSGPRHLKAQQGKKVSVWEGQWREGGISKPDTAAFAASSVERSPRELTLFLSSQIHLGSVTALHVLPGLLVTASKDRDVKLWERPSMQLVSMYVCVCVPACACTHTHTLEHACMQAGKGLLPENV